MTEARPQAQVLMAHLPHLPPFSGPEHTRRDTEELSDMLRELRETLDGRPAPRDGRVFVFAPEELRRRRPLAFVGFRGTRRAHVPPDVEAAVEQADAALVARMGQFPELLSYSCRPLGTGPLGTGDWINLVVLSDAAAVARWHRDPLHRQASGQLSPLFYAHVRLHGGVLPGGVAGPLQTTHTNYYDFSDAQLWVARRHF